MGELTPQSKPDEQFPLLKIDGGGGDVSHAQPTPAMMTPGVNYTKSKRFTRWPEIISACWMTLVLCGVSFLIFHALGMGLYHHQQFIIMKCNNSRPASNVFYHQIVPRRNQIPFVLYTEYLANMASHYTHLHFNVYFLIDDNYPDSHRGLKRNVPVYSSWLYNYNHIEMATNAFEEFQKRYRNVNVTVIPLSKYMAMTPLRYKWRLLPQAYLTFYARVFSVWQNGGVGIDLKTYNNDYHNQLLSNPRIDAILKQHNDGINAADYAQVLNKIDNDEANAIFSMFSGLFNNFLNETRAFLNRTLSFPFISEEKPPLIRTHRSKRQTSNESESTPVHVTYDAKNFYNIDNYSLNLIVENSTKDINESVKVFPTTSNPGMELLNTTEMHNYKVDGKRNSTDAHKVVLFYDFSIISDHIRGPASPYYVHKSPPSTKTHLLSIDMEGSFIAASSKLHPFLTHLISAGCFGMPPKLAIQDALFTQCSGVFKEDVYCNNIYIL